MLRQRTFTVCIAFTHRANLRHGDMAFIHKEKSVLGQIFKESWRRLTRRAAREVAGVVFNPVAKARGCHHLQIKFRPLREALGFDKFPFAFK